LTPEPDLETATIPKRKGWENNLEKKAGKLASIGVESPALGKDTKMFGH